MRTEIYSGIRVELLKIFSNSLIPKCSMDVDPQKECRYMSCFGSPRCEKCTLIEVQYKQGAIMELKDDCSLKGATVSRGAEVRVQWSVIHGTLTQETVAKLLRDSNIKCCHSSRHSHYPELNQVVLTSSSFSSWKFHFCLCSSYAKVKQNVTLTQCRQVYRITLFGCINKNPLEWFTHQRHVNKHTLLSTHSLLPSGFVSSLFLLAVLPSVSALWC